MVFLSDSLPAAEALACSQDLITLILIRLPVKSLHRFQCVSKEWLCIISNPRFCIQYRSLASAGIMLCRIPGLINHLSLNNCKYSEQPFTSLNFIDDSAGIKLLQSINGLVLCCSFHKIGKTRSYYVCNPSTRKFLVLPPPNADVCDSFTTIFGVNLVFYPSKSPHYQVVCVRNCSSSAAYDRYQIEIYSSLTHTWRLSGSPFVAPFDMVFENGVLWNGKIHWISPTGATLCFDIDQERLGSMPSPPSSDIWGQRRFRYFGESNGHLHLVELHSSSTAQFLVFEMERDYSSWIPKYQVDIAAMIDAFPEMVRDYHDPHVYNSRFYAFGLLFVQEMEEDSLLLLHIPGKFISYNLRDRSFKEICDSSPNSSEANTALHIGCFNAYQFIETLASV